MSCPVCGAPDSYRWWTTGCRRYGTPVCLECCRACEYRVEWSGISKCTYKTQEQKREEARKRLKAVEQQEILKISESYNRKRREAVRMKYIKEASARKSERRQS